MFRIANEGLEPTIYPAGSILLTTGIPSDTDENSLIFQIIADRKSKRAKN
jgi:hypothetical protein